MTLVAGNFSRPSCCYQLYRKLKTVYRFWHFLKWHKLFISSVKICQLLKNSNTDTKQTKHTHTHTLTYPDRWMMSLVYLFIVMKKIVLKVISWYIRVWPVPTDTRKLCPNKMFNLNQKLTQDPARIVQVQWNNFPICQPNCAIEGFLLTLMVDFLFSGVSSLNTDSRKQITHSTLSNFNPFCTATPNLCNLSNSTFSLIFLN